MSSNPYLKAFNNHFIEFCEDIQNVFPDNLTIKKTKMAIEMLMKTKPKYIAECWIWFSKPHIQDINQGNLNFFIDYNYRETVQNSSDPEWFLNEIEKFKEPVRNMKDDEKQKTMEYIQNLTKLVDMI